jgi:drug/metabolite transporter (DMT)-like permease
MGIFLGIAGGFWFSVTSIFVRIGQRDARRDDGVFMSVLVNVLILGIAASLATRPEWNREAMVAFVIAGTVATVGGRSALLRGVRLIGPSRSNAFLTGAPAVAATAGWIALRETLSAVDVIGGLIVLSGLLWLVRAKSGPIAGEHVPLRHYLVAAGAPLAFGMAFVIRKWGLERYDSSLIGAFVGSLSAFLVIVLIDGLRGKLPERGEHNFRSIPWWFVAAGFSSAAALLSQFFSFTYLSAWVVSILQATQGIWTIVLSAIFLKGDDRIDAPLIGAVVLVVTGVVLISVQ